MRFTIIERYSAIPADAASEAFLLVDQWDDWFKFSTMYQLHYVSKSGEKVRVGEVKIGQYAMTSAQRRPEIPAQFDMLDDRFFSIGQDETYYEELNKLGDEVRDEILRALNDCALEPKRFELALEEEVTRVSLLRSVSRSTVKRQFTRLARGGARLTKYAFTYTGSRAPNSAAPVELSFSVSPESTPPSNIHVLIGRNGVGKTHLLNNMSRALIEPNPNKRKVGEFSVGVDGEEDGLGDEDATFDKSEFFANLVSVTFSAFDPFEPLPNRQDKTQGLPCSYIGLKRTGKSADGKALAPKSPASLSRDFSASVLVCSRGARLVRWRRALEMLQADEIFTAAGVAALASEELSDDELKERALELFGSLSSGHKIVLLTITKLVETVEDRSLVLLDEPEAHLHPPLLSAFIRALSDLLTNRNGVAIIATHSPVVLQEVPADCAWIIRRNGRIVQAERPQVETFGENVGVLTREVFSLEVTDSGFHKLLRDSLSDLDSFEEVLERFDNKLGGEARALIRAILVNRRDLEQ
jgi:ABC-type multidrug transport system ATPase subunit